MACINSKEVKKHNIKSKSHIYLIGYVNDKPIHKNKLPTLRECLSVFFYCHINHKKTLKASAHIVAAEVINIWQQTGIPTIRLDHIEDHLLEVHAQWNHLKKNMQRRTTKQIANESELSSKFDKLFDIATKDAEKQITLSFKEFITDQRQDRKMCLAGLDKVRSQKENQKTKRKELSEIFRQKTKQQNEKLFATCSSANISFSDSSVVSEELDSESSTVHYNHVRKRKLSRSNIHGSITKHVGILSKEVCSSLDRSKCSDRQAVHILAASAQSLGHNISEVTLSRNSLQRARSANRERTAIYVKTSFEPKKTLTVHWDGKLLPDLLGQEKVDRLPVIVTGTDTDQLLGVPKLTSGTGKAQAEAVITCLSEWNICDNVKGICFDTTASNTGCFNGACVLIERALGRNLLHFACRHHIMEIVLEKVFTALKITSAASGPDIAIFKRFKSKWFLIDHSSYDTAGEVPEVALFKDRTLEFALEKLKKCQPRDDYRELLELTIIFLGGTPARGIHIQAPGALHRARWMSRVLYCYKIWIFRAQFKLKKTEESALFQFLLFVSDVYVKAWFEAPLATKAPVNDLLFIKQVTVYSNAIIKQAALTAFSRHLWYLSEIMVGLSFFDPKVDPDQKVLMLKAMQEREGSEVPLNRLDANGKYDERQLCNFVTKNTLFFHSWSTHFIS